MNTQAPTECVVSGALACVLHVSRATGIAPLQFRRVRTGWHARVSLAANVYGEVLSVTLCILTQAAFITDVCTALKIPYETGTNVRRTVYFIQLTLMTLVILTTAFTGTKRMKNMIIYLNQIYKINFELSGYGYTPSNERKYWLLLILPMIGGTFIIVLDFVVFICNIIVHHGTVLISMMYIFYYFLYIIRVILQIQFALITVSALSTLERLNGCLFDLLENTNSRGDTTRTSKSKLKIIHAIISGVTKISTKLPRDTHLVVHHLASLHCRVGDVIKLVDKSHGPILLLLLLACLLHLVITLYSFISHFLIKAGSLNFKILMQSLWAIFHISSLIMIVEPCHRTQEEVENTRVIVSEMTQKVASPDDPLSAELELFNRHLTLNQVKYSPLKMLTVNRTLIISMLGAITTYLTVVLQY